MDDEVSSTVNMSQNEATPLIGNSTQSGKKLPQYIAALSATLSALATGAIIGWSSPAGPRITNGREYGFDITDSQNAWVSSLIALGAAAMCFPSGFIMDKIGRKMTMLLMVFPFTLGWLLILFASNLPMLMIGRFITGAAGGSYCVVVPAYVSEIAQDNIRGTLGTFFQLMVTTGVLFSFLVGSYVKVFVLNMACGILPIIFGLIFCFMPESPYHLVFLNKMDHAKNSLKRLRGPNFNVEIELNEIHSKVLVARNNPVSLWVSLRSRAAKKAALICLALMVFQQLTGVNAVLFNVTTIFESANAKISSKISTILVGLIQVIATFISGLVIEKLGRRILLLISSVTVVICGILLGLYFNLLRNKEANKDFLHNFSWLPLASLCLFIIAFSIGFGPIPWLVSGELCIPRIKAFVNSSAGTINWGLAFIIVTTFQQFQNDVIFWFFAFTTFLAVSFVYFFMPETKGKSLDEIQNILNS